MRFIIIMSVLFCTAQFSFGFSVLDTAEGWASLNGGTTGGIGGEEVTVSTSEELRQAAGSTGKKIIFVKKGNYTGELKPQSDKSILGLEPGVILDGTISIVDKVHNVIIRNIAVINSKKCGSYQECKTGSDAVYTGRGATNVWLDHLNISDGQDGNCDVTRGADFVTITWCKFWYTYKKEHAYSNLIAGSNSEAESEGKLNITYAYNWWADNVQERQPWGRFGKIHILNNLWTSDRARYACASGKSMQMLIENGVFNNSGQGYLEDGGAYKLIGNIGTNQHITGSKGTVFTPSYTLSLKMEASEVETQVRAQAGNTLTFQKTGVYNHIDKKTVVQPYVTNTASNFILHNPTTAALSFSVVTLDGKIVVPSTNILAGRSIQLPSPAPSMFYVTFKGASVTANGYLLIVP